MRCDKTDLIMEPCTIFFVENWVPRDAILFFQDGVAMHAQMPSPHAPNFGQESAAIIPANIIIRNWEWRSQIKLLPVSTDLRHCVYTLTFNSQKRLGRVSFPRAYHSLVTGYCQLDIECASQRTPVLASMGKYAIKSSPNTNCRQSFVFGIEAAGRAQLLSGLFGRAFSTF